MMRWFLILVLSLVVTEAKRTCRHCDSPPTENSGSFTARPTPPPPPPQVVVNPPRLFFTQDDVVNPDLAFTQHIGYYGILYDSQHEFENRKLAFKENLLKIQELNNLQINAGGEATFGFSPFLDLSVEEFQSLYLGLRHNLTEQQQQRLIANDDDDDDGSSSSSTADEVGATQYLTSSRAAALSSVDWRAQNAVTPIKDQGQCGSCWAHSATEAIESFYFLKHRNSSSSAPPPVLSVQELLGCTYGSYDGCNGGWPTDALQTVINRQGIVSNNDYPYNPSNGVSCRFGSHGKATPAIATIRGYQTAPFGTLSNVLLNYGPPSVCLCSGSFQYYRRGVLKTCCTQQDHCIQAVGIGRSSNLNNGNYYWILRNSWGSAWGENGYIYLDAMAQGGNLCGVQEQIDYPTI